MRFGRDWRSGSPILNWRPYDRLECTVHVEGSLLARENLTASRKDQMFELMSASFEGLDYETFSRDLKEKDWVILLTNSAGRIVGFSTQMLTSAEVDGARVRAVFSGDTIVDRNYWGQTELIRIWGRFALRLIDRYEGDPLYWFLICMGYRTYRFLPVFFHEYYPRPGAEIPERTRVVLETLAGAKFGDHFDREAGIIRRGRASTRLRPGVGEVDTARERNPHIRFFVSRNPDHVEGEELACIAPLTRENLKPRAHAIIERGKPTSMEL